MVLLNFFNFIALFFGIFYSGSCRKDRNDNFFFSLFLDLSRPVFAWNEVWMVFCNFLNFFAIFLKFSILGRLGRIIFIFSLSRPVFAGNHAWMVFFNFFGIFYSGSCRMDRSDNFFLSLSQPVLTCFGLKWSLNCACQVFLFFCCFFFRNFLFLIE